MQRQIRDRAVNNELTRLKCDQQKAGFPVILAIRHLVRTDRTANRVGGFAARPDGDRGTNGYASSDGSCDRPSICGTYPCSDLHDRGAGSVRDRSNCRLSLYPLMEDVLGRRDIYPDWRAQLRHGDDHCFNRHGRRH